MTQTNQHIPASVAVARDTAVGGNAAVQGNAVVGGNLRVEGWLDAPNTKGPCKGLYADADALADAYPAPRAGWWALVGDTLPARVYRAHDGEWLPTGSQGGQFDLNLAAYDAVIDTLRHDLLTLADDIDRMPHPVKVADTDAADLLVTDAAGRVLAEFADGHIRTRNFDSRTATAPSLRICCVGNSYTYDCLAYLPPILEAAMPGIDITMGVLYYPACTLQQHLQFVTANTDAYETGLYTTASGRWQVAERQRPQALLSAADWDLVILQQQSSLSRDYASYQPYLDQLIQAVADRIGHPVRVGWLQTPAYPEGYQALDGDTTESMFAGIAEATRRVLDETAVSFVLPCGAAIQRARATELDGLGDFGHLSHDGLHLQEGLPCLIAAYAAAHALLPMLGGLRDIIGDTTIPDAAWCAARAIPLQNGTPVGLTPANLRLAQRLATIH